jgi:Ca2+-dependent lipid-binding protein
LNLKIVSGQLYRDTEVFGNMDPFVVIEFNGQKYRTKTLDESSKSPVWNETFEIPVYNKDAKITIKCYDEDVTVDDDLGSITLDVGQLC